MDFEMVTAPEHIQPRRIYIAVATLRNFHGQENVEIQLLRTGATQAEMADLRQLDVVGAPAPEVPAEVLAGATTDSALACLLEAFTKEEIEQLASYLRERYHEQVIRLSVCPMDLPVPLGVGPLAAVPESQSSGFIKFDLAPNYPLNFKFRGYYDLAGE